MALVESPVKAFQKASKSRQYYTDSEDPDVEDVERMRETLEETNTCIFCGFVAPVAWVHPSKGNNLSGNDIWDHVWAKHPDESEWFA